MPTRLERNSNAPSSTRWRSGHGSRLRIPVVEVADHGYRGGVRCDEHELDDGIMRGERGLSNSNGRRPSGRLILTAPIDFRMAKECAEGDEASSERGTKEW